jgi:hypothetical protein
MRSRKNPTVRRKRYGGGSGFECAPVLWVKIDMFGEVMKCWPDCNTLVREKEVVGVISCGWRRTKFITLGTLRRSYGAAPRVERTYEKTAVPDVANVHWDVYTIQRTGCEELAGLRHEARAYSQRHGPTVFNSQITLFRSVNSCLRELIPQVSCQLCTTQIPFDFLTFCIY